MIKLTSTKLSYCHVVENVRINGQLGMFQIGFMAAGETGRQVMNGPLVAGPWGWVNKQATIIDNTGEWARELKAAAVIELGEALEIEGLGTYRVVADPRPYNRGYYCLEVA